MKRLTLVCLVPVLAAVAADPGQLFENAEQLVRSNRLVEAMARVEEAVAALDRVHEAGEDLSWQAMNGLRFAARLARESFADYDKSLFYCDKLLAIADTDYWRVPARLERALTLRAMKDFAGAEREYDAIAAADRRQRTSGLLPRAEMVYFDLGDEARGRAFLLDALMNQDINGRERFSTLRRCAEKAVAEGRREKAVEWYAMVEKLPFGKAEERVRYLAHAWYEMGQVEESRGRTAEAMALYRKAMELEGGEMRFRARARDALESLEYFE